MVDFSLTDQQIELKRTINKFCKDEVRSVAKEYDAKLNPADCFAWPIVEKALSMGLGKATIPEALSGGGLNMVDVAILAEELAWGDPGFAASILTNLQSIKTILAFGTDEQKQKWIGQITSDTSNKFLIADCFSEPQAGSDIFSPVPVLGMKTEAKLDGDEYVINGNKVFITNGGVAKLYFVWARTDMTKGAMDGGLSAFVVPADTPGLQIGKIEDKLGFRLDQTAEINFTNCRIPKENLIGQEGMGFPVAAVFLSSNMIQTSSISLGIARAAYEHAYEYASQRQQGGTEIINHQAISHKLANMLMKIESTRALIYKAAWTINQGQPDVGLCVMSKVLAGETAMYAAQEAVQIFGCYGYTKDYPIEKIYRDAKVCTMWMTGNEAQKNNIMIMEKMKQMNS